METESTFAAPEGVYSMTDEVKPPPLIGTAAVTQTNNQLYPTKLSSVVVKYPQTAKSQPGLAHFLQGNKDKDNRREAAKSKDDTSSGSENTTDDPFVETENPAAALPQSPTHSDHPASIFSQPMVKHKKHAHARPKHSIRTTSSTFVSRVQNAEGYAKTIASKVGEVTFLFYNSGKNFYWVESGSKAKEPLAKVTFSTFPTCHDVNTATATNDRIDVIIGFSTGDLVWLDPTTARYVRLNKGGTISSSPCTCVRWVPHSSTLFLVSFADGTIAIMDNEREDGSFIPKEPSEAEWDPLDSIFVSMPPWHPGSSSSGLQSDASGKNEKERQTHMKNPVSHWKISRRKITEFVFSPDVKYVAAVSEDGCLRVIDALAEQLVDCYSSYFGSLTCIDWSPDGRFILTGGQDDLLTLFSPYEQRVIARCQGHTSFVTSVAFDEWRCDGRTYRFASVGEDDKLILWDFSSNALHRPKFQATLNQRQSMSSTVSLALIRGSALYSPSSPSLIHNETEDPSPPRYHAAPARNEIGVVQPVVIKAIQSDLYSYVLYVSKYLVTTARTGLVKSWLRPLALHSERRKGQNKRLLESSTLH